MDDQAKTNPELLHEISVLKQKIKELEQSDASLSRAEVALQKTNMELLAIIDNLPFLAWLKDSEGHFMAVNEPFARSCGLSSANDLVGKTDLDIWPQHLAEAYRADDCEVMRNRQKKTVEEFVADQGVQKWYETYKAPLYDVSGNVIGTTGLARDITERKQMEEALRESEEKYRLHFENATDIIFSVNPDLKLLNISPSLERVLGYTPEEQLGKAVSDLSAVAPSSLEKAASDIKRVLVGERIEATLYEYRAKDGTKRFGEVSASPLFHDGRVVAAVCVSRDITDRKQAEDDLQETLEKYRSLAAYVDSMYLVDRDGTYLFMNEGHLKRFGLPLEEICGKRYGDFYSEEDTREFAKYVSEVCETGQPITTEHLSERDGKFFLRTFTPIIGRSSDGNISQVAIIAKDITNIKLAEKKIQDILDSLRKAVNTTIQVMVSAVETRDPYTAGHQLKSANLARAIATEMGFPQEKIEGIRMAGSVHDIGKISIPAEILSKPTKLSEIEFSLIKEHARKGYELLKNVESPWPLAEIVYQHHERMDGSGYPRNLKGEEMLIEARILSVADVVEAMASHRPYRAGLGIDVALDEIEKNKGIFYDIAVADACLRLFREKGFQLEGA